MIISALMHCISDRIDLQKTTVCKILPATYSDPKVLYQKSSCQPMDKNHFSERVMVLIFAPLRCNVLVVATKKNKEFAEDSAGVLDFASVKVRQH
jgi:hypothetical protein